ncbi:c-type cytochrome biogenesis protein CcmI [Simiduia sp. 21SJ11W-1]|uniref:c-type cytochrome biogenesis protein CcmI n=1 Tax=Simiduia sp. 21SJ11W-1 TaxID=2909669 RepID=UPI00209D9B25|nr:c-type cytochrome biogenesis protein CcmI [Simiduia sp. 21SJ11W-1]UTA49240.1 c-type cytochrome biogenesis protein CcmI [Simiduia sp. 21SJ11W-1]
MTFFWVVATVLALLAAVSVLWPLWSQRGSAGLARGATNIEIYRERVGELDAQLAAGELDAEAHSAMHDELKLSLLDDTQADSHPEPATHTRGGAQLLLVLAVLLPVIAGVWYWQSGASQDVLLRDKMQAMSGAKDAPAVAEMLRARLDQQPENTQSWFTLARLYMDMGRYADATMAYMEVVNREPEAGSVVAEMAQALFLASNNQMTPEVQRITQRALDLVPENTTALGLAGIAAYEQQRFREAVDYWQRALAGSQPGSPGYKALQGGVAQARAALAAAGDAQANQGDAQANQGDAAGAANSTAETQGATGPAITVSVSLGDAVPRSGQTVFVYVRAWQGAKMPLAIERLRIDQLPAVVVLDDSKAMMAGTSLAAAGQLEVVARVSASGSPVPAKGDWQASQGPISLAEGPASVALQVQQQVQ